MKTNYWTEEEVKLLVELYPNTRNREISALLNRTTHSVMNKAHVKKLYKSKEFRSKMKGERNKIVGRDLSFEFLQKTALQFRTRGEFQIKDGSAYTTARRLGYLDKICEHMLKIKYSIPQLILKDLLENLLETKCLYNTRKIIPPYEIDVYFPSFKLAFEYNGKAWHNNTERDDKKRKLFKENGINFIYILEKNRRYEEDIKNQLIEYMPRIIEITSKPLNKETIENYEIQNPYLKVHNVTDLLDICKNYSSYKAFRLAEPKIYEILRKMRLLDKATAHMERLHKKWTVEEIKKTISKYSILKDFIHNDFGAYFWVSRHRRFELIQHLRQKQISKRLSNQLSLSENKSY